MSATELQKIETKAKTRFWYFKLALGLCMLWGVVGPAITWGISVNLLTTALFLGIAGVLAAAYIPVIVILAAAILYTGYTAYEYYGIYQDRRKSLESNAQNQLNELPKGNLTVIKTGIRETEGESQRHKSTPPSQFELIETAVEENLGGNQLTAQESAAAFSETTLAIHPISVAPQATPPNSITAVTEEKSFLAALLAQSMSHAENFLKLKVPTSSNRVDMLDQLISELKSINSNDPKLLAEQIPTFTKLTIDFNRIYYLEHKFSQPAGRSDEDTLFDTLLYFKAQKALLDIYAQEPFDNRELFNKCKNSIEAIKLNEHKCFKQTYESKGLFFSNGKLRTDQQIEAIDELKSIQRDAGYSGSQNSDHLASKIR